MNRKEIVKQLEEHFGVKAKYKGAPSFAYQIETEGETYTIDREGKITTSEGKEIELERLIKETVEEVMEQNEPISTEPTEALTLEIAIPLEGHTGATLRNLVNMIYSKQELIKKALGLAGDIIEDDYITAINEAKIVTLEDFKTNLSNIDKAESQGITFNVEDNIITFKFIEGETDAEKLKVYIQLIAMINQTAKSLKYASYKSKPTDNPKYTFRVWLLRLGFIGDAYKQARKILLENLDGNSAFRSGKPKGE